MGYRGKLAERDSARELRALGWTMAEIAAKLGVSKSSVSLWTRDVPFAPPPPRVDGLARFGARRRGPTAAQRRKADEIKRLKREGAARLATLSPRELLVAGVALYAAEGSKGDGYVRFSNSDPRMILFFCTWLRRFFDVDERRLRLRLYLHEGLSLEAATQYWARITGIPPAQHGQPYRAVPDGGIRHTKHEMGCPSVGYGCSRTHRAIMGLVDALLACEAFPG